MLYLGLTNGDLADPLGYGPLFARGNSNRYVDSTGRFPFTAGGAAAAAAAAAAAGNPVLDAVVLASAATTGTAIYVTHAFKHSEQGQALAESNKQRFGSFVRGVKALVTSAAAEGGEVDEVASPEAKSDLEAAQDRGATTTTNEKWVKGHLEKHNGVGPKTSGDRIHEIKNSPEAGLGGADDLVFDLCGGCYNAETGEYLGSLTEGGGGP